MAGGGGGNTTTRVDLPKWQQPYVQSGFQSAQNLYNNGGTPVAGFSGDTVLGQNQARNTAINGTINPAASSLATNTLNGGFLGSNPYLDATFNKAALATQNQLASQFAGSGRNIDASEGLRSQQLNDLATQIYGGNYQAERDRQQQTLGMSPALDQAQYTGANALMGIGAQTQAQQQQELDQPGNALDQYLQRVSGSYGQVTSQPSNRNPLAGGLGGAMLGSQIGGQYGYGGLGGILGGLGGYFGG